MARKKQPQRVSQPALGDVLLLHMPYDNWFLRRFYVGEDGERRANLIGQDRNRDKLYKAGLAQAKKQKGRLLQLVKAELRESREINVWEVLADHVTDE